MFYDTPWGKKIQVHEENAYVTSTGGKMLNPRAVNKIIPVAKKAFRMLR